MKDLEPVKWERTGCTCAAAACPLKPCPECPDTCERRQADVKFSLPRLARPCAAQFCPGPVILPPDSCSKKHRCRPTPEGFTPASAYCPPIPGRHPPSMEALLEKSEASRCNTEHHLGQDKLTGYKTIARAMPIPKWAGFRPQFPHPVPMMDRPVGCKDVVKPEANTYCCPEECKLCTPVVQGAPALCVAQVHPYISFNQVEKIVRTW